MNTKLRVLLVDDEYYFRKLLINLIDWEALGYIIEEEAENGSQALELARQEQYDLIVADINMPGMTGLDFVEALRSSYIETKVIFITSYDIFEFAQAAITLGASYYLLKPVDEDELSRALTEIREEFLQEMQSTLDVKYLKEQVERTKPLLRDHFVRQLLLYEPSDRPETLNQHAQFYDIPLNARGYVAFVVEIDELGVRYSEEQERQLWRFAVKNILKDTFESSGAYCAVIDGEDNKIAILVGHNKDQDKELMDLCDQARSFIDQRMHLGVTLAIGQTYESLSQVHLSYTEALYVLRVKFTKGGNRVIAYSQDHEGSEDAVFSLPIDRTEWITAIRNKNREALAEKIEEVCSKLVSIQASKEIAVFVLMECVSLGSAVILERGGTLPSGWMTDRHPLFRQMHCLETISGLQQWLQLFFNQIVFAELDNYLARFKGSDIVSKAVAYIEEHFAVESLTLQQTARSICANPSYLSHIFKRETGKSFTEYLSDLRLDRAMEMLREVPPEGLVSLKIVDVSQSVGYSDPYYFSKCFKRKFQIVPSKVIQT
ncbi:response regulator [Paenibacillus aceris]|uniref:Two-component system response regulator YesN n=1 Tax=Paenibacillus aceris TaxID=869555 RepID=A0ABS4I720_9BACL|nr:response regulator [Paenibacillus aceris]MBP1966623.1 two-component system response regulator YesN [Paenibacillus aceris]NHW38859.1 response regulator [Paenibacillus aceris]